jgi:hypothetical protein
VVVSIYLYVFSICVCIKMGERRVIDKQRMNIGTTPTNNE